MNLNRHQAVWDWFYECPLFASLDFIFSEAQNGNTVLAPISLVDDYWIDEYILGDGLKGYDFFIVQYLPYGLIPNNDENVKVLKQFEELAQWVQDQNKAGNLPDFTPDRVTKIEALYNPANAVAARDENGAKYMFSVRITYYTEGEFKNGN